MALFRSRDYPVGDSCVSLFVVAAGDVKVGVGISTTHITSQNVDCCIDGDYFFYQGVDHIHP